MRRTALAILSVAAVTMSACASTSSRSGVALGELAYEPYSPTTVCFEGSAPGIVAAFSGSGEGSVSATLTYADDVILTTDETVWPVGDVTGITERHIEIVLGDSLPDEPGPIHVRLEGKDNSSLEFEVFNYGGPC